jgi:hypothetical protein
MWWENTPFSALILRTKVIRTNDLKTKLIRCISQIQYWTVWNEVQTFECSRIRVVETKQGLSNEYQSSFTSVSKGKSKPLIRPNSRSFYEPSRCDVKIPPILALILETKIFRPNWCENRNNSTHLPLPILNRLERGSNVRILSKPNKVYRTNISRTSLQ